MSLIDKSEAQSAEGTRVSWAEWRAGRALGSSVVALGNSVAACRHAQHRLCLRRLVGAFEYCTLLPPDAWSPDDDKDGHPALRRGQRHIVLPRAARLPPARPTANLTRGVKAHQGANPFAHAIEKAVPPS